MTQKQQNTLLRLPLVIARRAQPDEAIHLAVAHRPFRTWTPQKWRNLLSENTVVVDVRTLSLDMSCPKWAYGTGDCNPCFGCFSGWPNWPRHSSRKFNF
jgi:hypothetical protein